MIKPIIFGKFILLERISVGGMAEVYRAKLLNHPEFKRYFAIKRILPNLAADEEFVTMFINEAKVAVELEHPNVCQIYELGRLGNSHYIAMEYISGRDIAAIQTYYRRQRKIMSISQACYIIAQAAEGLDAAHKAVDSKTGEPLHLIHRDVSPRNLIADFDGIVKLIDFGVAKASQRSSNTQSGVVKGKFSYMSPEQACDEQIDHRSDIFALGVIFWELLTGRRLFVSESEYAIVEMLKECNIAKPSKYNPLVPEAIDRICLKALERDPAKRYPWASDMIRDLYDFINSCNPPYTMWHLSTWLQKTYEDIYEEEKAKYEIFETLNTVEDVERYNQEISEENEEQAVDRNGNIIPALTNVDANGNEIHIKAPPPLPKLPKSDTKAPPLPKLPKKEEKKIEPPLKEDFDDLDESVVLTPEGVAPDVAAPETLRIKRIQKRAKQRKELTSVVITICISIILVMILVFTNVIHLPVPTPNLPTDATLELSLEPSRPAKIEIYNYTKDKAATPLQTVVAAEAKFEHLVAGRYAVDVTMEGFDKESFAITIENGISETQLHLSNTVPAYVDYSVSVSPNDAIIYVNDERINGAGDTRTLKGEIGKSYTIRAKRAGYAPMSKTFVLEEGKIPDDLKFELVETASSIEVKSSEEGNVFICIADQPCREVGTTPYNIEGLDGTLNNIEVEVRAAGFKTWSKTVSFDESNDIRIFADLEIEM